MTDPQQPQQGGDELDEILVGVIAPYNNRMLKPIHGHLNVPETSIPRAKAAINAYILAEVLDVSQQEFVFGESSTAFDEGRKYEQFRIKQAAIARFGKGETVTNGDGGVT